MATLKVVADSLPNPNWGALSNIFFKPLTSPKLDSTKVDPSWTDLEITGIIDNRSLREHHLLRYRTAEDSVRRWMVDTSGLLDFTQGVALTFRPMGKVHVASIVLPVRAKDSALGSRAIRPIMVPYQILYEGKYSYARIADVRIGSVVLNGTTYPIQVRPVVRAYPIYTVNTGTQVLLDFDRNGEFAQTASSMANGKSVAAEGVIPDVPFLVGDIAYELDFIDSLGTQIGFRRSTRKVAAVPGFRAPAYRGVDLAGRTVRLDEYRGRPVLLEFWSVECPYSESARAALNQLRTKYQDRYAWIAMAREDDGQLISDTLKVRHRNARIVTRDSSTWASFNMPNSTPHFVLLDSEGRIALAASGLSSVPLVTSKLDELLRR